MDYGRERGAGRRVGESQLSEMRNMRVLLEEAGLLSRDPAYHRRPRLEAVIGRALEVVELSLGDYVALPWGWTGRTNSSTPRAWRSDTCASPRWWSQT